MTTRQRVPTAIILVGSAFAAIGIALACGAIFVLRYRSGASTMLMVLVTFGWAIQARSVPIERASIKGSLRLKPAATRDPADDHQGTRGHGRGRHHGHHLPAFDIPVRRRARPCGADRLSLCGGRATPVGAFVSLGIAFCMGNWARLARPPRGEA
jgi:hypothetical protein